METNFNIIALGIALALFVTAVYFLGWLVYVLEIRKPPRTPASRELRIREIIENRDGYPSLAKFQFLVWTMVVLPVFTWVYIIRLFSGVEQPIGSLPTNILALMGISVASVPVSDALSRKKYPAPEERREGRPRSPPRLSTMLMESRIEDGKEVYQLSLARFQMFMWTFISVFIYLFVVFTTVTNPETMANVEVLTLPDIDPALVILMGLSQTGYIGAKATLPDKPRDASASG